MYIGLHVKYPLFLPDCNESWILLTDLKKKILKFQFFMKFRPVGAEFHADRRTDRHDEAVSRFSQWKMFEALKVSHT